MSARGPDDLMVEALRRANPVPAAQTAGRRELPSAHALFADVIAQPQRSVGRRVRKRALVVLIGIILIGLLVAAFVAVRRDRATPAGSIACYAAADLGARRIVTSNTGDPASACAKVWAHEDLIPAAVPPSFDVCVLPSSVVGVFPGESGSVCARLGLAQVSPSGDDELVDELAGALARRVQRDCLGDLATREAIQAELAELGLTGWKIERERAFDSDHPCGSLNVVPKTRTITIVPIADPLSAPG